MRITGGGGFHQNVAAAAQAGFHQTVVNRTHGQRSMHRQLAWCDMTIAEDQQHLATTYGFLGLIGNIANRRLEADGLVVVQVDDQTFETRTLQVHDRAPLRRRDHRGSQDCAVGVIGGFLEDITLGTQTGFQRHHDGFAQRVDRRVGDLCELLAEVVIGRPYAARQNCHGRIVAHRADRFLALLGQRTQHLITLLEGDLVHLHVLLELVSVVEGRTVIVVIEGRLDAQRVLPQPLLVGLLRLQVVVDVVGVQHLAGVGVHREDLPRADTALGQDVLGLVIPYADFRGEGDVAILGGHPTRRAQAVAVEQADCVASVGQHHASRAVPRLHVHGVKFVEGAQIGVHGLDVLPRWRNDHPQATEQIHSAGDQQLKHVVHARGVRAGAVDQRRQAFEIRQQFVGELQAARLGPVAVTGDGVDFTVVRQEAKRLSQAPLRHGVGGETLVEYANRSGEALVTQVRVELGQVGRHHQAFVDDVFVGEAANIEGAVVSQCHFRAAPGEEQLDAEITFSDIVSGNEHLLDARQPFERELAQDTGIDRHLAPADQRQALGDDLLAQASPCVVGLGCVLIEEHHADGILRGQLDIEVLQCLRAQKGIWLLHQQTATVAGLAIGIDAAAVRHTGQGLDGSL